MTSERILWLILVACIGLYGHHLGRENAPALVEYRKERDMQAEAQSAALLKAYEGSAGYHCDQIMDAARDALNREQMFQYGSPYEQ